MAHHYLGARATIEQAVELLQHRAFITEDARDDLERMRAALADWSGDLDEMQAVHDLAVDWIDYASA